MTAREMIDSLSGTLLCDERILSVPERELLANLLQRARTQVSAPDDVVAEAITRTVGELIAERALGVLGESMTRQLLEQQLALPSSFSKARVRVVGGGTPGVPPPPGPAPGSAPRPPGTSSHSINASTPGVTPPPGPAPGSAPRPPGTRPHSINAGTPGVPPPPGPAPGSAPRPPGTVSNSARESFGSEIAKLPFGTWLTTIPWPASFIGN